ANSFGNLISNVYAGTDVDGTVALPLHGNGIEIDDGAHDNTVFESILAGNVNPTAVAHGVGHAGAPVDGGNSNDFRGNFIGILPSNAPIPNDFGIFLDKGASNNTVGGNRSGTACADACNLISGNLDTGIVISETTSSSNLVDGNYI